MPKVLNKKSNIEIIKEGWDILVNRFGVENARRFIISFPHEKGDSVAYWKKFWGDKSIAEIHETIARSKK
jgi:hypothetical protein